MNYVYFIAAEAADAVKIGFSKRVSSERLATLQIGSPVLLTFLCAIPGELSDEKTWHAKLCRAHLRGEWFKLSEARAEIEAAKQLCGAVTELPGVRRKRTPSWLKTKKKQQIKGNWFCSDCGDKKATAYAKRCRACWYKSRITWPQFKNCQKCGAAKTTSTRRAPYCFKCRAFGAKEKSPERIRVGRACKNK